MNGWMVESQQIRYRGTEHNKHMHTIYMNTFCVLCSRNYIHQINDYYNVKSERQYFSLLQFFQFISPFSPPNGLISRKLAEIRLHCFKLRNFRIFSSWSGWTATTNRYRDKILRKFFVIAMVWACVFINSRVPRKQNVRQRKINKCELKIVVVSNKNAITQTLWHQRYSPSPARCIISA